MAQLGQIDLSGVSAEDTYTPLPPGEYPVMIVDSEIRENNAKTGSYLNLTLEVVEGTGKGRKVFDLLNLWNPNTTAVEIAQKTLKQICEALGFQGAPGDSAELHNRPLVARLGIDESPGYDPKNRVKAYKPYAAAPVAAPAPGAPTNAAAAPVQQAAPVQSAPPGPGAPTAAPTAPPQTAAAPPGWAG